MPLHSRNHTSTFYKTIESTTSTKTKRDFSSSYALNKTNSNTECIFTALFFCASPEEFGNGKTVFKFYVLYLCNTYIHNEKGSCLEKQL